VLQLPPEEVLEKAVVASRSLTSAFYTAKAEFALSGGIFGNGGGVLDITGSINEGGRTVGGAVEASVNIRDSEGQERTIHAALDTVSVESQRFYLLVRSLSSTPEGGIFDPASVARLIGVWWEFSPSEDASELSVSPSPRLLQAQASVVQVTRDLGIGEIEGIPAYHYAVALDPDRFFAYAQELAAERKEEIDEKVLRSQITSLQATGELWISAADFHVLAFHWEIPSLRLPEGSQLRVDISVSLSDHGSAATVVIPSQSQPFPNAATILPGSDSLDEPLPEGLGETDIRSAVEDNSKTAIFPPTE
jgi:hypothetical protein